MLVTALVVENGLALERVLGVAERDLAVAHRLAGQVEGGEGRARVTAGAGGEELERRVFHRRRVLDPALVA